MSIDRTELLQAARDAATRAYAPYSRFPVGAALLFEDGKIVTGANVENASYGLSLCAEAVAVARAMTDGRREGLVAVAVTASADGPVMPCGRCRQMLFELSQIGGTDPLVIAHDREPARDMRLSALLPHPFGPDNLG